MKKLIIVVSLITSYSSFAQTTEEVKLYIKSMIQSNQPSSYSYDIGFGESYDDSTLEKWQMGSVDNKEAIMMIHRNWNAYNVSCLNFIDLKGIRNIAILEEEGYVILKFFLGKGYQSKEYSSSGVDVYKNPTWEISEFPSPVILLGQGGKESARKLKEAILFLAEEYGAMPVGDLF
ncbi:hypothetical protein [Reichenbachiella agariperforans]|uniref:hypothetical protein n=1 Tax=Reichenbachiella agariperforans TaxID=156994 RepID=UPI001C094F5D|nr:hypothetical protein [Reichenbachiella agariperforans]MBU2915967.1 hypothetical protein [Reichenbachiella agariperforans]